MLYRVILLWLLAVPLSCSAQWSNNNWFFGHIAGVQFSSGQAENIGQTNIDVHEGCASMSDSAGSLLFYTDGDTVFDRDQIPMQNGSGLLAGQSSTQGALIVRKPGSDHLFYLCTVPSAFDTSGFVYSEIDMQQNFGKGVVTSVKNVQLLSSTTEKLTGVQHSNGVDFWIIVHEFGSNAFFFYLVDMSGIGSIINTSNIGPIIQGVEEFKRGYMRVSTDGGKLVMTNDLQGNVELFQLNSEFGFLSDPITLNGFPGAYGLEFSPNGQKLYMTRNNASNSPTVRELYQFDLGIWDQDSIMNSAQVIDSTSGLGAGALALGPDGIIYVAQHFRKYLGAILDPDESGPACQYTDSAVFLDPFSSSRIGLPNFIKEPLDPSLNIGQTPVQEEILKAWWVDGSLNFELLQMPEKNWDLSVHDLAGRKVAELKGRSEKAWQIPTTEWNTAVYVWRWNNGNESRFGKVYVH